MQPPTCTRSETAGLKHVESSPSAVGSAQSPPSTGIVEQYWKCPISSDAATLYECAAHGTRVCSLDVAYIGWKPYALCEHCGASGSKLTCANPFAGLAVMEPI